MTDPKRLVTSVRAQLIVGAVLRCLLLGAAAYLLVATFVPSSGLAWGAAAVGLLVGAWLSKLYQDLRPQAIRLIHQTVGDAEYSLPLLDKAHLNLAEQLQLERLQQRISTVRIPTVTFAHLGGYVATLLLAGLLYVGVPMLKKNNVAATPARKGMPTAGAPVAQDVAPAFRAAELRIQPPAYTQLPARTSSDLNASAIVGSRLTWRLTFSKSERLSVRLVNSRGAEVTFRRAGDAFVYDDQLASSGLYALKAYWSMGKRDSLVYQSDFYRLEAQPDLAPRIEPASKELYRYHERKDPKRLTIAARVSDDFRVSNAFIVATVARGSGENVKFREVRMPVGPTNFKDARLTKTLDLNALGFAPGDELYYYWSAFDNRRPEPNFTKSDTYFLVYRDTTQLEEGELATMAVNIMPEYFRSQRQIIIDTEKLIASRRRLSDKSGATKAFKSASNEIGFDQKALRLRYGQFLGEEFENSIGGGNAMPTDEDGDVVVGMAAIQKYMHKHDEGEGEHTPAASAPSHAGHDHAGHSHGGGAPNDDKDPVAALMEQYVHNHDDAETNTFHEQSTRSLLKMALENMWQSELQLRLYEPEKALPFEKKALEYLKLSQQKARSYVRKTGFDPPPIKEADVRLTGELKNVNENVAQQLTYDQPRLNALVAEVLGYLNAPVRSAQQRQAIQQLGNALANPAINSGLTNWSVLATLQKAAAGKPLTAGERNALKTKLYDLIRPSLPGDSGPGRKAYTSDRQLERAFWRHLP